MSNELVIKDEELEIIKQSQLVLKTSYDDRVLVKSIADGIATPKTGGYPVNMADVLQIVRIAVSMHLDPMLGGIWGYKDKNGRLVCGIAKKGWQQALHSQPDYAGIVFKNHGELQHKKFTLNGTTYDISYYEAVTCYIKKIRPDGREVIFEGTAYFDEEFMANKEPWLQRPKRMLEGRAMTICASNAYGWGAYDIDELSSLKEKSAHTQPVESHKNEIDVDVCEVKETVQTKAKALMNKDKKATFIDELNKASNKEELTAVWKKLPASLKKDEELITIAKNRANEFEEEL